MLELTDVNAWYGDSHVLHGMSLEVKEGEVVTLLGRNGAGKTTTLKTIMGMMAKSSGSVEFRGQELLGLRPDIIARKGIATCPEHRGIFASLTVMENLMLPPKLAEDGMGVDELEALFPNIFERGKSKGTTLSGGEQQMLAIARILRSGAKFLLMDELTEGLAPVIIEQITHTLNRIRERGYTIILVEQNAAFVKSIADRHYLVQDGKVIDCVEANQFDTRRGQINRVLGL
jgi:branched-chain amino acid transport system ATP-binding protein